MWGRIIFLFNIPNLCWLQKFGNFMIQGFFPFRKILEKLHV